jgi:hypothetical protein
VVGPEEGVEAQLLSVSGDPQLVLVRGTQLRFGENHKPHAVHLAS